MAPEIGRILVIAGVGLLAATTAPRQDGDTEPSPTHEEHAMANLVVHFEIHASEPQ